MSQIDENKILERLKHLSQVEPGQQATDRAIQKARDALLAGEGRRVGLAPPSLINGLIKLAAAAVLMVGAGFIGGRLSAPEPLDVQQLQAALESSLKSSLLPAIQQELLTKADEHWQSTLAASNTRLKEELARQVRSELELLAERTMTAVGNLTDQRLMEFARIIEAARIKDRQRVEAAFNYMGSRFGDGLVTLATRTDNLLDTERAGSTPDVSEN